MQKKFSRKKAKNILVVDDDEAVLESIRLILEDEGFLVDTAVDGAIMQEKLKKGLPDLIIIDYRLPGENGTELTKNLKKNRITKNIPIVIVSSHDVSSLAKNVGATDFFEKPFDIEILLNIVSKHLP